MSEDQRPVLSLAAGYHLRARPLCDGRIKQDRAGSIDYIRQSFKVSDKIAENSYNEIRDVMLDDMIMPEERLKKAIEGPYARSEGEKSVSINDVIDYSILRSLR